MFGWLDDIIGKIKNLSGSIDKYKEETVIQSLPSLTYVNRAKKFIEKNQLQEAELILNKALNLAQKDALVYKYLGLVYEKQGKTELAVENYQASADIDSQDKTIWQKLGFALINAGKYENAEKSFENANKIQGNNTDTFTGWGMSLMKQKRYDEAREKFAEASKINKYNFSAVFLCAVMEMKLEMYDKAELKLTFLANVCPNESNTFEFARLRALKGDKESAIHYALKSLDYNPNLFPAYILLGQLYGDAYDEENALKYFKAAEDKELVNSDLYLEWSKVLEKFEKYDEAKCKLLKAFELSPENIEVMAHLGLCCVTRKEFDEAKPLLEKCLDAEPENLIVKQALGIVAYENNELEKAMSYLRSTDEDAINCYYMAKCYEKMNNDTKVKDYYEAAILINPKYISAFADYSRYLISKSEYAEAQRKLRKALKADDNNIVLLNLLFYASYILVKENVCEYNVKEAITIADKIINISPDLFEYPEQKAELSKLLQNNSERE